MGELDKIIEKSSQISSNENQQRSFQGHYDKHSNYNQDHDYRKKRVFGQKYLIK